jgi:hypothetical protein
LRDIALQVFCKNDAAFLCGDCNTAAHNNPLAARHTIVSAAEAMESEAAASVPDSSSNTTEKPHQQQLMPAVPAGKLDKESLTKTVFGKDLEVSSRLWLAAAALCSCCSGLSETHSSFISVHC